MHTHTNDPTALHEPSVGKKGSAQEQALDAKKDFLLTPSELMRWIYMGSSLNLSLYLPKTQIYVLELLNTMSICVE